MNRRPGWKIDVWSSDTFELVRSIESPVERLRATSLSEDGALLAIGAQYEVAVMDVATGSIISTMPTDEAGIRAIAISPDGSRTAYVDGDVRGDEAIVWLHDSATGERLQTLEGPAQHVLTIEFSPDGSSLAGGTRNGKVLLWDISTAECRMVWDGRRRIRVVRFSPDGSLLASTDDRGTARLWFTDSLEERLVFKDTNRSLADLAFSPDGLTLAVSDEDGSVRIRDLTTDETTLIVRVHEHRGVNQIEFLSNTRLATACGDLLALWKKEPTK